MEFEVGRGKGMPKAKEHERMGVVRVRTQDEVGEAASWLKQLCADAAISKKVDRVMELTEKVAARRAAAIPDTKGAPSLSEMARSPGPSASQMAAQWRAAYAVREARVCAESEAAYAARNPHKREQK